MDVQRCESCGKPAGRARPLVEVADALVLGKVDRVCFACFAGGKTSRRLVTFGPELLARRR